MTSKVEQQYSQWVYPDPIPDMRAAIANGHYEIGDPLLYWPLFWPRKRDVEKLDILIAGCGTNQAAYYACRNPNWNVLGIDLSDSSLAHQNMLRKKHGLNNLRVEKLDIINVSTLGNNFDFITSTGVLHHLRDPDQGLAALGRVLRPNGVMNLMVYGMSLRLGVYLMQELFRILDFKQTKADVDLARVVIDALPADHVVKRYVSAATDLHYDAGIVDTFFHPQDRAYYVKEIYDFARRANLEFLSWSDPIEYSLGSHIPAAHPLWPRLKNLSPEIASHVCDLLCASHGTHRFALSHPEHKISNTIPFDSDDFFRCTVIPHRELKILDPSDPNKKTNAKCKIRNVAFEMDWRIAMMISNLNGDNCISQVINELRLSESDVVTAHNVARDGFRELWKLGYVYVLLPTNNNM